VARLLRGLRLAVELELETGRLVVLPVEGFPMVRHWFLVHRSDKPLSAASQAFRDMLLAQAPVAAVAPAVAPRTGARRRSHPPGKTPA
jgi:DNA-binding transcriptional LysR family regulator